MCDARTLRNCSSCCCSPACLVNCVTAGRIIDGHGDLRPEHICLTARPVVFDCLEFDPRLRLLDVADELSFLAMECDRLGAGAVGEQVRNACFGACRMNRRRRF